MASGADVRGMSFLSFLGMMSKDYDCSIVPLFSAQRIFGLTLTPVQLEWVCLSIFGKMGDDKCEEGIVGG